MHLRFASCEFPLPARRMGSRGFSFTEILFAVMILGIGFIMVAAMFPVAIHQTEISSQETVGAALARTGVGYMSEVAQTTWVGQVPTSLLTPTFIQQRNGSLIPPTYPDLTSGVIVPPLQLGASITLPGQVFSCFDQIHDNQTSPAPPGGNYLNHNQQLWAALAQNFIQGSDPRYAWVGFYKRDLIETKSKVVDAKTGLVNIEPTFSYAPNAQVIAIAVKVRNGQSYQPADILAPPTGAPEPALFPSWGQQATLYVNTAGTTILNSGITFGGSGNAGFRAAEGAYVIIADDTSNRGSFASMNPPTATHGLLNGHVYRIGGTNPSGAANSWEFAPGNGLTAGDLALLNSMGGAGGVQFDVWVVGVAPDPNNPGSYTGPAQDVAVYSTFVPCPK